MTRVAALTEIMMFLFVSFAALPLWAANQSGAAIPGREPRAAHTTAQAKSGEDGARGAGHELSELDRNLREAASLGDAQRVKALLQKGAGPNSVDKDGITPLMIAVVGDIERVRGIAVKGIAESWQKGLPKVIKAMKGDAATALALIQGGAAVNAATSRGIKALDLAALGGNPALVTLLLDRGADANLRAKRGETTLMVASAAGHDSIVKLLLARGADPLAQSQDGITAAAVAMLAGNMEIVKILTKATTPKGSTF